MVERVKAARILKVGNDGEFWKERARFQQETGGWVPCNGTLLAEAAKRWPLGEASEPDVSPKDVVD